KRHTSFSRHWSSDVCSSDLPAETQHKRASAYGPSIAPDYICRDEPRPRLRASAFDPPTIPKGSQGVAGASNEARSPEAKAKKKKIGRAACRERVNTCASAAA